MTRFSYKMTEYGVKCNSKFTEDIGPEVNYSDYQPPILDNITQFNVCIICMTNIADQYCEPHVADNGQMCQPPDICQDCNDKLYKCIYCKKTNCFAYFDKPENVHVYDAILYAFQVLYIKTLPYYQRINVNKYTDSYWYLYQSQVVFYQELVDISNDSWVLIIESEFENYDSIYVYRDFLVPNGNDLGYISDVFRFLQYFDNYGDQEYIHNREEYLRRPQSIFRISRERPQESLILLEDINISEVYSVYNQVLNRPDYGNLRKLPKFALLNVLVIIFKTYHSDIVSEWFRQGLFHIYPRNVKIFTDIDTFLAADIFDRFYTDGMSLGMPFNMNRL